MSSPTDKTNRSHDCWNREGIQGNGSCQELEKVIHCRNCRVYEKAAEKLFDRELPEEYLDEWTEHLSRKKEFEVPGTVSVAIFRIGKEWLALSTKQVSEVTETMVVHRIPHLKNSSLLGLVNIHGKIQLCFSFENLLGIKKEENLYETGGHKIYKRMLVAEWEGSGWVFPVDEMHTVQSFQAGEIQKNPETVSRADNTYTRGILRCQDKDVGYLDHDLLFSALKRRIL